KGKAARKAPSVGADGWSATTSEPVCVGPGRRAGGAGPPVPSDRVGHQADDRLDTAIACSQDDRRRARAPIGGLDSGQAAQAREAAAKLKVSRPQGEPR